MNARQFFEFQVRTLSLAADAASRSARICEIGLRRENASVDLLKTAGRGFISSFETNPGRGQGSIIATRISSLLIFPKVTTIACFRSG